MILDPLTMLWILLAGVEAIVVACIAFAKRPGYAAVAILVAVVGQAFSLLPLGVNWSFTIYLPDLIFAALIVVVVINFKQFIEVNHLNLFLFVLLLLVVTNLVRGATLIDLQRSVNEARPYIYFLAGAMYFSSASLISLKKGSVLPKWVSAGCISAAIAVSFWLLLFTIPGFQPVWSQQAEEWGNTPIRVLSVQHTMFLASAYFLSLGFWMDKRVPWLLRHAHIFLLPVIFLLSHRTVWVVMIAGIVTLVLLSPSVRSRLLPLIVIPLGLGALYLSQQWLSGTGDSSSRWAPGNMDTFLWRMESTGALLGDFQIRDAFDILIGQPFGRGFEREIAQQVVEVQPHNFYVQTLLSLGIIGLVAFLLLYINLIRAFFTRLDIVPEEGLLRPPIAVVLIITQLVFFVTYGATLEMGVILGLTMRAVISMSMRVDQRESTAEVFTAAVTPHTVRQAF